MHLQIGDYQKSCHLQKIGPFLWWLSPFCILPQNLSIIIAMMIFLCCPNKLLNAAMKNFTITLEVRKRCRIENIYKYPFHTKPQFQHPLKLSTTHFHRLYFKFENKCFINITGNNVKNASFTCHSHAVIKFMRTGH